MKNKIDWVITLDGNGIACSVCGRTENQFIKGYCNAKTIGMNKYGHPEFQMVLHTDYKLILYTLNSLGLMVREGKTFQDGDIVYDLFDGYEAKLKEFVEDGEKLLRVLIPDANHKFPDDEDCQIEYCYQGLPIEDLYKSGIGKQIN